ncbi:MAG: GNAT family N-acetyltransferase [Chloroflexi bacterium]|nr:GNAT family N-acetyltransferase [Chloroflexota bacterium]
MDAPALTFHPLTPGRLPDLAALFGQGGDPKWCWCAFFRVRGLDFKNSTRARNRTVLQRAVEATAAQRRAPGLMAYEGEGAIGWVSLGPRDDYERLIHSRVLAPVDDEPVWSIVCFVVSRRSRGRGVARALLDAAIEYARGHGAKWLEAYPADTAGGRISSANAYTGTLSMFERAGFRVVARRQANRASPVRPIVRLRL